MLLESESIEGVDDFVVVGDNLVGFDVFKLIRGHCFAANINQKVEVGLVWKMKKARVKKVFKWCRKKIFRLTLTRLGHE